MQLRIFSVLLLASVAIIGSSCEEQDRTNPVIVLTNPDYNIRIGGTYEEQGALATDREGGVLDTSALIIYNNQVRTDSVAEYTVSYFITDAAGNEDSTDRFVSVYASRFDYQGTWNVAETCADTQIQTYTVDIAALGDDTTFVSLSNLRNRGAFFEMGMTIRGGLGRTIELADTVLEFSYAGNTVLAVGTLDSMRFELDFTEKDSLNTLNCSASFTKP